MVWQFQRRKTPVLSLLRPRPAQQATTHHQPTPSLTRENNTHPQPKTNHHPHIESMFQ
nr:MAG TPA: hypothetical protein [Caudoviricetes sp.]